MAGKQLIDELASERFFEQEAKIVAGLKEINDEFLLSIRNAKAFSDTLAGAKGLKDINTASANAAKEIEKLNRLQLQAATAQQNLAKAAAQREAAELRLTQAQERQAATTERQANAAKKASGEYERLNAAYREATTAARNAGAQFGENSTQFQRAASAANILRQRLDAIDQPLGNYQRNVGNYGRSFDGLGNSVQQLAREFPAFAVSAQTGILALSNNLPIFFDQIARTRQEVAALRAEGQKTPGVFARIVQSLVSPIGLLTLGVTVLTVFSKEISNFVTALFKGKEAIDLFAERQRNLAKVFSDSNKDIASQTTQLKYLYQSATDVNNAMDERLQSAKKLQEEYPKTFGLQSQENIINGEAIGIYNSLTQEIIKNARAKAAANNIAEQEEKILAAQLQAQRIAIGNQQTNKKLQDDEYNDLIKRGYTAQKAREYIQASLNSLSKATDLNDVTTARTPFATAIERSNKQAEKQLAVQANIIRQAGGNISLIENVLGGGTAIGNGINDDPTKATKKEKKKKDTSAEDELRALEYQYEQQIALARELDKNELELEAEYNKQIKNYRKLAYEEDKNAIENYYNDSLELIQQGAEDQLIAVEKSYALGKIGKAEYEKSKLDIEYQANRDSIEAQLSLASQIIALQESQGLDVSDQKKKLSELTRKLAKADADYEIAQIKSVAEARKALNTAIKDFAKETFNFGVSLVNASYENEKNRIQEQSDNLDLQKDKEIKEVDRSLATEQEKADKIAVINAKAQAQKDVLDQRRRQVAERQAKFDKAVNIANIIANTYAGAARALKDYPFPFSAIIGGLVIATGLAQAATVIATPIPKYAKGTEYHKGGPMIVGDAGQELVIEPNGRSWLSPDGDMLTNAPAGTKVIPNAETMRILASPDKVQYIGGQQVDIQQLVNEQKKTTKAIQGQKMFSTVISRKGWANQQNRLSDWNNRKTQYFN